MQPGKIWVADHDGVYVIKLVGDVVVLLKDRSLEKARKKAVKTKSKTRKKKKANK